PDWAKPIDTTPSNKPFRPGVKGFLDQIPDTIKSFFPNTIKQENDWKQQMATDPLNLNVIKPGVKGVSDYGIKFLKDTIGTVINTGNEELNRVEDFISQFIHAEKDA